MQHPDPRTQTPREPHWRAISRGIAASFGLWLLCNAIGEIVRDGFDTTIWLIDLRPLGKFGPAASVATGSLLVLFALFPQRSSLRISAALAALAMAAIAVMDSLTYWLLLIRGSLHSGLAVPTSLVVVVALLLVLADLSIRHGRCRLRTLVPVLSCLTISGSVLLLQMLGFGMSDYRRPADAALVLGARVYADGKLSLAAADRVRTGAELYNAGLVRLVIVSGGPGDGAVHECDAMANSLEALGVPREAIMRDFHGLNTEASIRNTRHSLPRHSRVLVVSHFYHLARIKLCAERAGLRAYTVPAEQSRVLARTPYFMAREAAALIVYWLRGAGAVPAPAHTG